MASVRRMSLRVTTLAVVTALAGSLLVPQASAQQEPQQNSGTISTPQFPAPERATQPAPPSGQQPKAAAQDRIPAKPGVLNPIDPGPDGSPNIENEPSKAQPLAPLPALDPGPDGRVPVERVPIAPNPPVTPAKLDLPTRPGQELVDATSADALATLAAAGRTVDGKPALDANALQPQVKSAQFIGPNRPATLPELVDALTSGNLPPPLPVDPLALLQQLPDGIPRITYRVCSESRTKAVSCSLTLPLGVPAIVDVTGDRTPDVLTDLVPAAAPGDIVGVAREITNLDSEIAIATNRLNVVLELLKDPINVILHPELLVEKLQLEGLLRDLRDTVQRKVEALLNLVHLGLGLVNLRLPTSEFAGRDLPAHVWAVYDLPTHKRISVGFDGVRRGAGLPTAAIGLYTFAPLQALRGIFDIKATVLQVGAADSLAITAGLTNVTDDDQGLPYDPTVASARFSPVPRTFDAHAFIDPGSTDRDQRATVDARTSERTKLDVQVLSNSAGSNRFDQLVVDQLPNTVSAALIRPRDGGDAIVDYTASDTINDVLFADFVYAGEQLDAAVRAAAKNIPTQWRGALNSKADRVTLDYDANAALAALDVAFFDRDPAIVLRGALRTLPTVVNLDADIPGKHVLFDANTPLGSAEVFVSKDLGGYAPLVGEHATGVLDGAKLGASARVTGLRKIDVWFDQHPRGGTEFSPGGQPFVAAGVVDGRQKSRLDVSNLPATLGFDLDTTVRRVQFNASSVVQRVKAAYVDTANGPSAVAAINGLPQTVDVRYDLGDRPKVSYRAASAVPRAELFVSPQGVEQLDPTGNHYLSAALTDVPTEVDVLVDLPARHLNGTMSAALGSISAVARTPFAGRDFLAIGELTGVPARFDADFADGLMRFRGLSGALGAARFSVTNHAGATMPAGQHVSAHYRQVTGDFDGSVSIRNLTLAEYSRGPAKQVASLQLDTDGQPVFVDADVVLAVNGVDDTRLAVTSRIDNLPTNLTLAIDLADGKLTYTGDKSIGLLADVHVGKVSALNGLGAPILANGVAVRARGCDDGGGCTKDESPICTLFGRCLGLVGTIRLTGLPAALSIDLVGKEIEITGYTQPAGAPLTAYLEVSGLLPGLPRLEGQVSLDGLPSNVDLTVGPITVDGNPARVDVGYRASAPLGVLRIAAEADTSTSFGTLRARASVDRLPATVRVTGTFDSVTKLGVHNSAPIDEIAAALSGVDAGYLDASATGVPADLDVLVDAPAKHFESAASARLGAITFRAAKVPFGGREYQAFAQAIGIPAKMTADWADGNFRFQGTSGAITSAAFAVTNHAGAAAPRGQHVAAHYRQGSGDLDASASVGTLSLVSVAPKADGVAFDMRSGSGTFSFDGDFLLAADNRYTAFGRVSLPSTLDVSYGDGKLRYRTDRPVGLLAEARVGKRAALDQIGQVPLYAHGVAAEARACAPGTGCARDDGPICSLLDKCFGAVGTVNLPGLPTTVDVDLAQQKIDIIGYRSPAGVDLTAYVRLDGLLDKIHRGAALAVLEGLPSPFNLHIGPFGINKPTERGKPTTLHVGYDSSGGIALLRVQAEADTAEDGTVRAAADVHGVPSTLVLDGSFGADSRITVKPSADISMINAHVTGLYNNQPASARARLTNVPGCAGDKCIDVDVKGTDSSGNPLKVPLITIDTPRAGMDAEAYVQGHEAINPEDTPIHLQLHDVFFRLTDMGTTVRTAVTEANGVFVTKVTSTPAATTLTAGGNFSLQTDRIDVPDPNLQLPICDFPDVAFLRLNGHIQVQKLDIGQLWVYADNFTTLTLQPGEMYLAYGVDGDYSKFGIGMDRMQMNVDANIRIRLLKFNQDWIPPLYENTLELNPNDTHRGVTTHVFDQKYGPVVDLEFRVGGSPTLYTHTLERIPRVVAHIPPNGSLSGIEYTPDQPDRRLVFSLIDPGLPADDKPLVDLAVAFKFSPFDKSGDPNEPPCD